MIGYVATVEVEMSEHFGHWSLHLWSPNHHEWVRINCAAETAGREVLEAISRIVVRDGFALEAEAE